MKKLIYLMLPAVLAGCGGGGLADRAEPRDRYVLLQADGMPATRGAPYACLRDEQSSLVWELKSDEAGLHDWRNTYSWYNPTQAHHELDYRGTADAGSCSGSQCDTWSIVAAANEERFCGFDDWRMPSKDEMFSISDLRKAKSPPTIAIEYFPHAQAEEYWTANDYSFQPDSAWVWNFQYGHDRVDWKKSPKLVRLVRGDPIDLTAVKE